MVLSQAQDTSLFRGALLSSGIILPSLLPFTTQLERKARSLAKTN